MPSRKYSPLVGVSKQPSWFSSLLEMGSKGNYLDEQMRETLGEFYEPLKLLRNINRHNAIQARMPFIPNVY